MEAKPQLMKVIYTNEYKCEQTNYRKILFSLGCNNRSKKDQRRKTHTVGCMI